MLFIRGNMLYWKIETPGNQNWEQGNTRKPDMGTFHTGRGKRQATGFTDPVTLLINCGPLISLFCLKDTKQ